MAKPRTTIFQKKEHNRAQVLLLFSEKLWIRGIFYNGNIPINGAKGQGFLVDNPSKKWIGTREF
jgi:hypothetical protein